MKTKYMPSQNKRKFTLILSLLICGFAQSGYSIELKTSFIIGSYPRFYIEQKNETKAMAGMCIDILKAFEQKAPEIHFSYKVMLTPFARIKHELEHNTIQAVFGVARDREREKIYQYADTPLYPVKFLIFALASDKEAQKIKTLEDIQAHGGRVLGLRGTNAIKVFQDQTVQLGIPVEVVRTMEQNVNKVLSGRGSFFTYNHIDAIGTINKLGHQDKFITLPIITKEAHHWLAFSKQVSPEIVEKANNVLKDMEQSGELRKIYEKYVK